jgi:hypothetical protein
MDPDSQLLSRHILRDQLEERYNSYLHDSPQKPPLPPVPGLMFKLLTPNVHRGKGRSVVDLVNIKNS